MPKPEAWRLDPAAYPVSMQCDTRFQDLDLNRHLNNVAYAALFENARVQLHHQAKLREDRADSERTMVAAIEINYLGEGYFPDPVTIKSGVGHVGNTSWKILQAMFQNGHCIATCDSVVVCRIGNESKTLRTALREQLRVRTY
jgi:acyl-CoA thioester hydrolase